MITRRAWMEGVETRCGVAARSNRSSEPPVVSAQILSSRAIFPRIVNEQGKLSRIGS